MSSPSGSAASALDAEGALEALADGFLVVAPDWRILFANAAFDRLFRVPARDYVGHSLRTAFPALCTPPDGDLLRRTMAEGVPCSFQIDQRDTRLARIFDVRASRMRGGGICIQVRDVSEAVRFDEALAQRNEENASLREVARALAEEVDLAALLRLICQEAASQCRAAGATVGQITGGELEVVAGTGLGDVARGIRFRLEGSSTERAIIARSPVRADDYPAELPDLAATFREFQIGPVLSAPLVAHDQVVGVLLVVRRVGFPPFTEAEERRVRAIADHAALAIWKSRLFEQAQDANRTKSEFMAVMSHELRTPLTALTGYEELLADQVLGPLSEQQLGAVERMRSSTELLTVIIDEILTFSRLEAGAEPVHPRSCTAGEIIRGVADVLLPLASAKGLELRLPSADTSPRLHTDPDMARRILVNLGANAVKFTTTGSVSLDVSETDDVVRFAVRDTGIGIAAQDLQRLFQPFAQLETGLARRFGGTGLGLYISQRLAALLGGWVEVESTVGEGSVFVLALPSGGLERN